MTDKSLPENFVEGAEAEALANYAEVLAEIDVADGAAQAHSTYTYESLGKKIGVLVDEKQKVYGDSFGRSGEIMKVLYPDGIKVEDYGDALAVIRIIDKLFRIATDKDALGESPFLDIAGYGLLGAGHGLIGIGAGARRGETHESNKQQPKDPLIRSDG